MACVDRTRLPTIDGSCVGHHDVLAVARYPKASFLQGPYGVMVIDAGDLGHVLRDVDFAYDSPLE